ncbi:hypothetical protein [Fusobacterium sp. MFO224]|uniref:hypothetical protein n=1 Tax=Fusobacterium sp. MFO224 TaxID=3378070 RepID=UPI003855481B
MTLEDLRNYQGQQLSDEEFKEIEDCNLVKDIVDNGNSPMYPQLNWYVLELETGELINIFI